MAVERSVGDSHIVIYIICGLHVDVVRQLKEEVFSHLDIYCFICTKIVTNDKVTMLS